MATILDKVIAKLNSGIEVTASNRHRATLRSGESRLVSAGPRWRFLPESEAVENEANQRLQEIHACFWQILLQKSFRGGEQKFLEPLMRFARSDVRGHIVSSKIDHGLPYWR